MTTIYKKIDDDTIQFFTTNKDNSVTHGSIVNGRLRTRQIQTGTQQVQVGTEQVQIGTEEIQVDTIQVESGTEQVETGFLSVETGVDEEGNPTFEDQIQYDTVPVYVDQAVFGIVPTYEDQPIFEEQPVFADEEYSPWDELMLTNPTIEAIPQSQLDAEALDEFKANRQELIDSAVVNANGFSFDADEVSIGRLASAVLAAITEDDTFVMQWSLADTSTGVMTDVTLADLKLAHKLSVLNMSTVWGI